MPLFAHNRFTASLTSTYLTSAQATGNGTYTFSSIDFGTGGIIAVGIYAVGSSSERELGSCTIGGSAAAVAVDTNGSQGQSSIIWATNPGGTGDIVIPPALNNFLRAGIIVWRLTGVSSVFDTDTDVAATSDALELTGLSGSGILLGIGGTNSNRTATWTGQWVEDAEVIVDSTRTASGASFVGVVSGTQTLTWSGGTTVPSLAGCIFV